MQLFDQSGKPVEVPDDQAAAAFQSGQYGLPQGARVPVKLANGEVGTVEAHELQATLAQGGQIAPQAEYEAAEKQAKYGDAIGQIAAGGAALARGASAGLSDPLAIGLGGIVGGKQGAEKVRTTLQGLQEANPTTSTVGEIAGAVAPLVVGEGAGLLGEGVRGAGSVARGIQGLGELAESGAAHVLGEGSGSFLSTLARRAVEEGANAGVQAALYSAGNQISEDALGDTETNGEKLLAAVGHGFLLGAAGGGLLASTGEMGREILGRAAPALQDLAETGAWRSISGRKAFQTEAEKIPGGQKAIGRVLLDDRIVSAGDRVEDIAPKVSMARKAAGEAIGDLLDVADNAEIAGPKVADVQRKIVDEVLPDLKKLGNTNAGAIGKVQGVLEDLTNFARQARGLPEDAEAHGLELTFREAQDFRKRLDDLIKWNTNPLAPRNETTEALKGVRNAIESSITDAGEGASKELGGSWAEKYDAAKLKYRQLTVADKAAQDAVERFRANAALSLTDKLMTSSGLNAGLMHGLMQGGGAHALAAGGVHGMALGAVTGALSRQVRMRGASTAAVMMDRLSSLGGLQRAIRSVDMQIDRGVASILRPGERATPKLREAPHAKASEPHEERVKATASAVANPDEHTGAIADAVAPIAAHAPGIASSFQRAALRATALLGGAVPKGSKPTPSLTPQFDKAMVSDAARDAFDRASHLAHDPVGFTFDQMNRGTLTRSDVAALKTISPSLHKEIVSKVSDELMKLKKPLPYGKQLQIETLLGVPDPGIAVGALIPPSAAPKPQGFGHPPSGAPKRQLKGPAEAAALTGSKSFH